MAVFGRRRGPDGAASEHVPGLRAAMLGRGWQPAAVEPFGVEFGQFCTQIALAMHNLASGPLGLRPGPWA